MLSKKMAFSLTSLITIFALAFMVPSAMAGEFDVTIDDDANGDISTTDGLQVVHPGTSLKVTVKFGEIAILKGADVFATTYDKDGKLVDIPTVKVADEAKPAAKTVLTIPVTAAVEKVNLKIKAAKVAPANPLSANTSKKLEKDIFLIGGDAGAPTVYSIERVGINFRQIKTPKINPTDNATFQVRVTLSEEPKEFKTDHIDVAEGAATTVTALVPEMGASLTTFLEGDNAPKNLPRKRMIYDETIPASENVDTTDTNNVYTTVDVAGTAVVTFEALAAADTAAVRKAKVAGRAKYSGIHRAINEAADLDTSYKIAKWLTPHNPNILAIENTILNNLKTVKGAAAGNLPKEPPKKLEAAEVHPVDENGTNPTDDTAATDFTLPKGYDRSTAPTMPNRADYGDNTLYTAALNYYNAEYSAYAEYFNSLEYYKAYMKALEAEQMKDDDARMKHYEDNVSGAARATLATGADMMLYPYLVTITPKYENTNDVVVKVKSFEDRTKPVSMKYIPPIDADDYLEGVDKLTIMVSEAKPGKAKDVGVRFALPKDKIIPAGGYLVVAEDKAGSAVHVPGGKIDESPKVQDRNSRELLYNVIDDGDLPNLERFLINGGVIDVIGPQSLVITEVMWGSDESLDDVTKSQWIELYNAGAEYKTQDGDNTTYLVFYQPGDPLAAASTIKDRIGTIDAAGLYWGAQLPGQRGRTGSGEAAATLLATTPTQELVSMNRVMTAGVVADGQMATSWVEHTAPAVNFSSNAVGSRIGSPGAARLVTAAEIAAAKAKATADAAKSASDAAKAADKSVSMLQNGLVYISEIMVDRGNNLPQWIEISNGSRTEELNLGGWTLTVDNASEDIDVSVGGSITFTIPEGTKIGMFGQNDVPSTLLVVTEAGRNNLTGAMAKGQILNLWESNKTELILGDVTKRRYSLLSQEAFLITLAPPEPEATTAPAGETKAAKALRQAAEKEAANERKEATDMVGNLGADGAAAWTLPMNMEGGRSSILRAHIAVTRGPAEPEDGMEEDSWALASETAFAAATHVRASSYYGAANDTGTPGFRAGGALPVELSEFSPARDKVTDAVVITWATQSELNNAGFFIKRSQQADGEFKVINATMVPGAGTTSEKQFYTYTDTTAQPNVVYYYQIEDVSLDGQRQTLTRGIRLKGHVGAAGKATTLWGELKTSHE